MEYLKNRIQPESRGRLLKPEDVANLLDIHVIAVNTLVDLKLLPAADISTSFERRFREDDVRFLIQR